LTKTIKKDGRGVLERRSAVRHRPRAKIQLTAYITPEDAGRRTGKDGPAKLQKVVDELTKQGRAGKAGLRDGRAQGATPRCGEAVRQVRACARHQQLFANDVFYFDLAAPPGRQPDWSGSTPPGQAGRRPSSRPRWDRGAQSAARAGGSPGWSGCGSPPAAAADADDAGPCRPQQMPPAAGVPQPAARRWAGNYEVRDVQLTAPVPDDVEAPGGRRARRRLDAKAGRAPRPVS